jgi:hypothetical protein
MIDNKIKLRVERRKYVDEPGEKKHSTEENERVIFSCNKQIIQYQTRKKERC